MGKHCVYTPLYPNNSSCMLVSCKVLKAMLKIFSATYTEYTRALAGLFCLFVVWKRYSFCWCFCFFLLAWANSLDVKATFLSTVIGSRSLRPQFVIQTIINWGVQINTVTKLILNIVKLTDECNFICNNRGQ